jgi:hypothetical protein
MSTVAPRVSGGALVDVIALGIDALGRETAQPRGPSQEFASGRLDEPGLQAESSIEREFRVRGRVDDEWGRSESLDPDNVGDIADEGMGHRG